MRKRLYTLQIEERHVRMCAALADVYRQALIHSLANEPLSVNQLVTLVGLSQPTVSRHLRILREGGIVVAERRGKSVYYFLTDSRFIEVLKTLRSILEDQAQHLGKS